MSTKIKNVFVLDFPTAFFLRVCYIISMKIFYINYEKYFVTLPPKKIHHLLQTFAQNFKSLKRQKEYAISRFLLKYIPEKIYGLNNLEIGIKNKKPYFVNCKLNFSITHSRDIVAIAFSDNPIGLDIEFIKKRNFEPILERLGRKSQGVDLEKFYQYWTEYEAKIKLQQEAKFCYTEKLSEEYILTVCSGAFDEIVEIEEVTDFQ